MKKLAGVLSLVLFLLLSAPAIIASADDLVIHPDGQVILVVTSDGGVLAASTENKKGTEKPSAPPKIVPLVSSHTASTVKIDAPKNPDKKIQVTITTPPPNQTAPSGNTPPPKNAAQTTPASSAPTTSPLPLPPATVIQKTVDRVVAEDKNGQPLLTVTSDQANQLTLSQGPYHATTTLTTLQFSTVTNMLSIPSTTGPTNIAVLPARAVEGAVNTGVIDPKNVNTATITLTKNTITGIDYNIQSIREGKLLGVIPVTLHPEVTISAETGKPAPQPIFSTILGRLTF